MTVEASTAPARKATQPPHSGQASRQNGRRVDDRPLRELLDALRAARDGDFSVRLPEGRGVTGEIAAAFNQLVERNASVTEEIGRVSRLIGGEGQLTERASLDVPGGDWSTQIDSVNSLIEDLARPTTEVGRVIVAVAEGDLSQKMALEIEGQPVKGAFLRIGTTINTMVDQLSSFADEVTRVAKEVGTEGELGGQAEVKGVSGTWRDLTENVNFMAGNLTTQVRNIAQVATAVAEGDLSQKITADAKGEILELKNTINTMVDQLSSFAAEVTRVAREVGTEGELGGQATVEGVSGTWRGLTDNVNFMADNLTGQVRNIAQVTTAVANGDLSQKITADAKGEILELKNTINTMVDQLSSFADEVTRVAREVGTDGKLGGQARVEGVSGTWRGLTDNVNQLAENLTTQVRAIAEVSTAVTQGDLTREIAVDAQGELAELKDNINQMIGNLRDTTQENAEQDWLKTNLARISGSMQGQRDLEAVSRLIMSELTPVVSAHHGAFFMAESKDGNEPTFKLIASYGYKERKNVGNRFALGEGLVGQAALERKPILLAAPSDYIKISSGLGEAAPVNVIVMPVVFEDQLLGVIELASFRAFSAVNQTFLDQLVETIGVVLNTIIANMRTEELLEQSQSLAHELQSQSEELQSQQDELKRSNGELEAQAQSLKASEELLQSQQDELKLSNEELEEKARQLAEQNSEIEVKNREIETARVGLEEKARELSIGSKYKSEFLANMSHELRTPLNSLLILARLLADNPNGNLTAKQVEFASTIHGAGADLLTLINDILDLSKVEAGKMDFDPGPVRLDEVRDYVERSFMPVAGQKGLAFDVEIDPAIDWMVTDQQRLQQILKNLLSNAFKFTDRGRVSLRVVPAGEGIVYGEPTLNRSERVIAFSVADTGVGMAEDKLKLIFEAFQQADGTTSRRFGGTGLGLSISRELARLLGGEIRVTSQVAEGSAFVLYLPDRYPGAQGPGEDERNAIVQHTPSADSPGGPTLDIGAEPVEATTAEPDADARPVAGIWEVPDDRDNLEPGDRAVLIIEDDVVFGRTVLETAHAGGYKALVASRGDTGLAMARRYLPPTVVLDLSLPVTDGMEVLTELKRGPETRDIAVHVVSGSDRRREALGAGASSYNEKPVGREALETAFAGGMTTPAPDVLAGSVTTPAPAGQPTLEGRTVLVVDDDLRNVFALSSALERDGVEVLYAENGRKGIEVLESASKVDLVLMDVMMPEMDGYETTRAIRRMPGFETLPIISLTAKAMKGDREKSIESGATDYITKPVDPEQLPSMLMSWLEA